MAGAGTRACERQEGRGLRNNTDACESQRASSESDGVEQLTGEADSHVAAEASEGSVRPACSATIRNLTGEAGTLTRGRGIWMAASRAVGSEPTGALALPPSPAR